MEPFPHRYTVRAAADAAGDVSLSGERLSALVSAPPAEFGGPGDRWSPETLVVAAMADCFVLTFRAFASRARLRWTTLACDASGTVDRVEHRTQFTAFSIRASLAIADRAEEAHATLLLARAEENCLVANSLKAPCHLEIVIRVIPPKA